MKTQKSPRFGFCFGAKFLLMAILPLWICQRSRAVLDADGDGMPASFESLWGLSDSNPNDAGEDPDHDGLTNLEEYLLGTYPGSADTDGDGLIDGYNRGLDAYWQFEDSAPSSYFQGSGNGSILTGGPSLSGMQVLSGLWGKGVQPGSSSDNLQAYNTVLNGATEWGFSCWFKINTVSTANVLFAAKVYSASTNKIGASLSATGWGSMTLYITLAGTDYSTTVNIASGSGFHHLAVSRDQTLNKADVYFDGSLIASVSPTTSPEPLSMTAAEFFLGTRPMTGFSGYYDYFHGVIDEVRLYHRRLEATEVNAFYENGSLSANASKYWTLSYLLNNPQGQQDSDGDGFTNLAEVIAGTDPQNSASKPAPATTGYQLHTKLGS
jgi:hypothetical protein